MPYFIDGFDDDDQDNVSAGGPAASNSETIVGDSGVAGGGSPNSVKSGEPTSSGRFTNLQAYLDANKGSGLGQNFADKIQGEVTEANQAQDTASAGFKGAVDNATNKFDLGIASEVSSAPSKYVNSQAGSKEADELAAFKKMQNSSYSGPNSFAEVGDIYDPAYKETQQAVDYGEQSKTDEGRKSLLSKLYNTGNYTTGQQSLDNLLLAADPDAQTALSPVQADAKATSDRWAALQDQLNQYAQGARTTSDQTKASVRSALGLDDTGNFTDQSQVASIDKAAQARAATMNKANQDRIEQLARAVAGEGHDRQTDYYLNDADINALNLRDTVAMPGFDIRPYITAPTVDKNMAATADEQAKVDALYKLAGLSNTTLPYADKAGYTGSFDINTDKLRAAQIAQRAAYDEEARRRYEEFKKKNPGYGLDDAYRDLGAPQTAAEKAKAKKLPVVNDVRFIV